MSHFLDIPTLAVFHASTQGMISFPSPISKLWPKILHYGSVCVASPPGCSDKESIHFEMLSISARNNPFPHASFASSIPHFRILSQQHRVSSAPSFEIHSKSGQLPDIPFIGSGRVLIASWHAHVADEIEEGCRRDQYTSKNETTAVLDNKSNDSNFWSIMQSGLRGNALYLWYSADFVLSEWEKLVIWEDEL